MTRPRKRSGREQQATSYHVAGHAVVSVAQGFTSDKLSIVPGEEYNGICREPGVLGYKFSNRRECRSIARALTVSCYAGMHAERLVDADAPESHDENDEDDAFQLSWRYEVLPRKCGSVGDDCHYGYLNRLRGEARRLMQMHRKAIEKLADLLLQRLELTRDEAEQFIEPLLDRQDGRWLSARFRKERDQEV